MKRILTVAILVMVTLFVSACAYRSEKNFQRDVVSEDWYKQVDTGVESWKQGASAWFLSGSTQLPKKIYKDKIYKEGESNPLAQTSMEVEAPHFAQLTVDGPFRIQIFGSKEKNTVTLFGPNAGVRAVMVEVKGDTLCIKAAPDAKNIEDMQKVIVRIGAHDLRKLVKAGAGQLEARLLNSSGLTIDNKGSGHLYLAGNFKLDKIDHSGSGCISIFGANASCLAIITHGSGRVNVAGRIGLKRIEHQNTAVINVVGAQGGDLKINAKGKGKIGLYGRVNIKEINATGQVCVYAYNLDSSALRLTVARSARVGLAGYVAHLQMNADGHASIEGRYLKSKMAYVSAENIAHINVGASRQIFATATQNASIYYFGLAKTLTKFTKGNGLIMTIWSPVSRVAKPLWKDKVVASRRYRAKKQVTKTQGRHKQTRVYKKK